MGKKHLHFLDDLSDKLDAGKDKLIEGIDTMYDTIGKRIKKYKIKETAKEMYNQAKEDAKEKYSNMGKKASDLGDKTEEQFKKMYEEIHNSTQGKKLFEIIHKYGKDPQLLKEKLKEKRKEYTENYNEFSRDNPRVTAFFDGFYNAYFAGEVNRIPDSQTYSTFKDLGYGFGWGTSFVATLKGKYILGALPAASLAYKLSKKYYKNARAKAKAEQEGPKTEA